MLIEKIISSIEVISAWFSDTILNHSIDSYCDLETTELPEKDGQRPQSFVAKDGGLLSILIIDGNAKVVGDTEQANLDEHLYSKFKGYLKEDGHLIQVTFESDPDTIKRTIHEALLPSYQTAKRIGLKVKDVLLNQEEVISQLCVNERCYFGLWTQPTILPPAALKREFKDKAATCKKLKVPVFYFGQNLTTAIQSLKASHEATKTAVIQDLKKAGLILRSLSAHEALKFMRFSVDPTNMDYKWEPCLPGDKITCKTKSKPGDASNIAYPPLSYQVFNRRIKGYNSKYGTEVVRIGKRIYAPLLFEVYPQEVQPFSELLNRVDKKIPWRISFFIEPNGLEKQGLSKALLSFVGFIGGNKEIKKAYEDLQRLERDGEPVVRLRIALVTWAENEKVLEDQCSSLTRAVQGWGTCDVTNDCGDPISGFVSSLPSFSKTNIAPSVCAPLYDAIRMLPTAQPASPWQTGAILFRTPGGKLFPCQPGSSEQIAWIDLIFGPMGSGKSVHLNRLNWAFCLQPGLSKLPLLSIIDVGPSSKGLISLLKEGLPEDRKYEAGYFLLRNVRECAINSFDTQLGCRYPTQYERDFIINFITLLATPAGTTEPLNSVSDMAAILVDEAYELFSDLKRAKLYEKDRDLDIDEVLSRINYETDEYTTWWNVVDALFKANLFYEASQAQRFSVPILSDLIEIIKSNKVRDIFEPAGGSPLTVKTGEKLTDAITRIITTTIRNYPLLSCETKFNTGACRVFSIDLNEVAKGQGAEGEKRAAIMFLLAKHLSARNFYINPDMVSELHNVAPDFYKSYHTERAKDIFETPKLLGLDELHRAGKNKSPAFMDSLIKDGREGRKNNLLFSLSSQLLDDFPDDLVTLGTSFYILKSDDEENIVAIAKKFNLNNAAVRYLRYECNGPIAGHGANFIGIFKTKRGLYTQALINTIGSIELWAFATTNEDRVLREYLYKKVSPAKARQILAKRFPGGSAKKEVEKRKLALGIKKDDDSFDIIKKLADEMG